MTAYSRYCFILPLLLSAYFIRSAAFDTYTDWFARVKAIGNMLVLTPIFLICAADQITLHLEVGPSGILERSLFRWRFTSTENAVAVKNYTRQIFERKRGSAISTRVKTERWTILSDGAGRGFFRLEEDVAERMQIAEFVASQRSIRITEETDSRT